MIWNEKYIRNNENNVNISSPRLGKQMSAITECNNFNKEKLLCIIISGFVMWIQCSGHSPTCVYIDKTLIKSHVGHGEMLDNQYNLIRI